MRRRSNPGILSNILQAAIASASGNPSAPLCYACNREATTEIHVDGELVDACDVHAGDDPDYTGGDDDEPDDDELDDAVDEYEAFHWGNRPDSIEEVEIPDPPRTLVKIGALEGVIYRTAKGKRKQESWVHFHDEKERPTLAYDPRTGQMYILGGKYKITPHGIED
jgi:hypothetical protein